MLLEPLVSVIEAIKGRIATHGSALRQNETRTRAALIDPLLQALGWDTTDPGMVTPEFRVDVGWADYALLGVGGKPAAVVEAKRLGSIVENHLEQAVGYCIQQGIAYAGVTDGSHWQLYRTFEPVPLVEKLVLDVAIADASAHECALKLLLLWRPNLASGQSMAADAPVLVTPLDASPVNTIPKETLSTPDHGGNWVSLSTVVAGKGNSPPVAIEFSGGEVRQVSSWSQVLVEITEKLAMDGTLTSAEYPIPGLNFINSAPISPGGNPFQRYKQVSGGLYLNMGWNASNIIRHSLKLLSHFSVNPETVQLQFD